MDSLPLATYICLCVCLLHEETKNKRINLVLLIGTLSCDHFMMYQA
jgi:hypothetical protein